MSDATGAMQQFNTPSGPRQDGRPSAGLLLLYAEGFSNLPATWPVTQARTVIGREAPADVRVAVHAVSRIHAELVWERGGFTLRDLDSTNGTLLDGRQITEARIEPGQEIRVGDAILKFVDANIEAYAAYRLDGLMLAGAVRQSRLNSELVGGFQMDRIAAELERVAKSPLSVMLLGESGTGKEVVARELHRLSGRRGDFCAINCAAIPGNLLESELFGYKRGAFSGADRDKPGLIRTAHEGTLLLDEIGDMPLTAQAKLLRTLQSHEVFPLGATKPETVDVRVVCATHRDLKRMQLEEKFRPDLFARLNEYQLRLPPLRDRKEDVYLLFNTFLERHGRAGLVPTFRFMTALLHYDWPYNVRELEACAKRCIALAGGTVMDAEQLPDQIREEMVNYGSRISINPDDGSEQRGAPAEDELRALLGRHQGNIAAVGRELGKARMQVHRWLKRYEITLDDYR
jgi:DNA-binding NtrC family response regulator